MSDSTDLGATSAEALEGAERMAAELRKAGWRVEPPSTTPITGLLMSDEYRKRVCQWVRDNGLDPSDIPADADIRIDHDRDTITTDVFARGEDGNLVVTGNHVLRKRATVPLRKPWSDGDPPADHPA
ncbi:hypothetical protein [Micromonospora sp. NPDC023633]|uniref:hypothetical protein n=1 Tax=Micromonospora sp. NPDC023633 TaxID=3154320 RepID=UPI0033DCBB2E